MGGGGPDVSEQQGPRYVDTGTPQVQVREDANPIIYPTGYTSFDKGKTYQADPNTHFRDQYGNAWYVEPGQDPNDKANWQRDTMQGYHASEADMRQMQAQEEAMDRARRQEEMAMREAERAKQQWNEMFAFQQEQASLAQKARNQQLDMLEEERMATQEAQAAQRRKEALFRQRALRFSTNRRRGRAGTVKTGSLGLKDEEVQTGKARLLGGTA
jgi:hypothetical protein